MLESKIYLLPTSEQLPSSDDTQVDNEDQNFILKTSTLVGY